MLHTIVIAGAIVSAIVILFVGLFIHYGKGWNGPGRS
jgi:hypothetical protein